MKSKSAHMALKRRATKGQQARQIAEHEAAWAEYWRISAAEIKMLKRAMGED